MKLFCGVIALACVPVALAKDNAAYPTEKVAEFVIQKLDVAALPASIRPKRDKSKKTFSDYGFVTRQLGEKDARIEAASGDSQINIRVLEQDSAGIFVCIEARNQAASNGPIQRVFLLKLKNTTGLLKGRESWKEFDSCPVIGGASQDSAADSYSGGRTLFEAGASELVETDVRRSIAA